MPRPEPTITPVAAVLAALLLMAGCAEAVRGLSSGPGGPPAALALVDGLRARYGAVEREPGFEALRPKLNSAVMVPSRVFEDASIWTVSEGDWRALWLEGRGRPGAYRLGVRAAPALPHAPGDYRARVALSREGSGRFEWSTNDELALGPLGPEELSAAFRGLLRAAEAEAGNDVRPQVVAAMPRAARAFGRLIDLEVLSLSSEAGRALRVELALRLQPERLKPEAPKYAAYVARYSRGLRLAITALVPDGRPLWTATIEDTVWRLRLRVREGSLVPLDGPPHHQGGRLRAMVDYSFKSGMFRVGVSRLAVDVDPAPAPGRLALAARFVEQPDWQLPFLIRPFMRGSLHYPFEGPGSEFNVSVRPEPGRGSLLVSDSRVRIRESWIVRWLSGFTARALDDLRAAETEADRFTLECLTAVREDVEAHSHHAWPAPAGAVIGAPSSPPPSARAAAR